MKKILGFVFAMVLCFGFSTTVMAGQSPSVDNSTGLREADDGNWYLYVGDEVNTDYTGLYNDAVNGWWLVEDGQVNFDYTGLYNDAVVGWWLVQGGAVDFGYTGLYNDAVVGWWLVQGGAVNFGYTGSVDWNGATYNVVNGYVVF